VNCFSIYSALPAFEEAISLLSTRHVRVYMNFLVSPLRVSAFQLRSPSCAITMSKYLLSAAVVVLLLSSAKAQLCSCTPASYKDTFKVSVSVHKVRVDESLLNGKFYRVTRLADYKGCGKRPKHFVVKDPLRGTSCESTLVVGTSYLVHLDGSKKPPIFLYCANDQEFDGLSADVLSYLLSNNKCCSH
jgi:hypothetical protein